MNVKDRMNVELGLKLWCKSSLAAILYKILHFLITAISTKKELRFLLEKPMHEVIHWVDEGPLWLPHWEFSWQPKREECISFLSALKWEPLTWFVSVQLFSQQQSLFFAHSQSLPSSIQRSKQPSLNSNCATVSENRCLRLFQVVSVPIFKLWIVCSGHLIQGYYLHFCALHRENGFFVYVDPYISHKALCVLTADLYWATVMIGGLHLGTSAFCAIVMFSQSNIFI